MTDATFDGQASTLVQTQDRTKSAARLNSIDLLRGLVIVLMVLDHVRDFFHATAFTADPMDPASTNLALFATRFVTHFCAPVFVFLAGTSAFLQRARGKDRAELSVFLLTRGLWLVVLELTLITFAWNFSILPYFAGLQVIWAIGWSMVILAALIWLPTWAVLAAGVLIVAGHNLLDPVRPADLGAFSLAWTVLHEGGPWPGLPAIVLYPLLPWTGVMALGYGAGALFQAPPERRARILTVAGLAMLAAFALLRASNLYGDPRPWSPQPDALRTAYAFLNVAKYPPSLDYVLVTLGGALLLLPRLERLSGPVAEFFLAFGRVPLFAYAAHILLAHGLSAIASLASGRPVWGIDDGFRNPQILAGFGFSLPVVYAVWILVVLALWPLCRWFAELKRTRRDWWLSYL